PPYPVMTRECVRWAFESLSQHPECVTDDWLDSAMEVIALPKYRESIRKVVDEGLGATLFAPTLARDKHETLNWLKDGRLQRPTQIIWSRNDRTASIESGLALFEMIRTHERRTEFHLMNDAGHISFREQPELFNALMIRFVERFEQVAG